MHVDIFIAGFCVNLLRIFLHSFLGSRKCMNARSISTSLKVRIFNINFCLHFLWKISITPLCGGTKVHKIEF